MKTSPAVVVGISGARQNAAVSLCIGGRLVAFCEQERVTRVRRDGLAKGSLPMDALGAVLRCADRATLNDIQLYVTAESDIRLPADVVTSRVDHHRAHAATAFYLSPFDTAGVLVCDRHPTEPTSAWVATDGRLTKHDWPALEAGFASLYSEGAALFGLSHGQEHELEGLARLDDGADASRLEDLITYRDGALLPSPQWKAVVLAWLADAVPDALTHQARVASAFQHHLGSLLLAFACDFRQRTGMRRLCVGGGLFYNTFFTTLLRQSGIFEDVFIAPNPGNAGTAIGAVLDGADDRHPSSGDISPFLGPEYSGEEIKATLENCKLSYECLSEEQVIATAVKAIAGGQLVGWFQGRMEWAQRALGHRSILANPLSPYALDNLNTFLKHRPRHRAYGVSIPIDRVAEFFDGPPVSRFMEYEYRPSSLETFQHMMPSGMQTLRVQTIDGGTKDGSNARYERLHREFGKVTNVPVLVNTSFNGFSEPMVCSPRDAIRVFFGTGLDLLVLDHFVVRK